MLRQYQNNRIWVVVTSEEVLIAYVKTPNLARNKDSETAAGESTGG